MAIISFIKILDFTESESQQFNKRTMPPSTTQVASDSPQQGRTHVIIICWIESLSSTIFPENREVHKAFWRLRSLFNDTRRYKIEETILQCQNSGVAAEIERTKLIGQIEEEYRECVQSNSELIVCYVGYGLFKDDNITDEILVSERE